MIPKFRAWNTETKEIEVFQTYEEISELFLALSAENFWRWSDGRNEKRFCR